MYKITDEAVRKIHQMRASGLSAIKIASNLGLSHQHVWEIICMRRRKAAGDQATPYSKIVHRGEANARHKLTESDVLSIHQLRREGERVMDICKRFSITREHAWCILTFRSWAHLKPLIDRQLEL